jgi:hypothetical protein
MKMDVAQLTVMATTLATLYGAKVVERVQEAKAKSGATS